MKQFFGFIGKRGSVTPDAVTCAPSVDGLVQQLGDRDGVTRERARRSLVSLGSQGVEPLLVALRNKKSRVRFAAAMCLRDNADRRAPDGLVEAVGDVTVEVRWVAAEALINIADPWSPRCSGADGARRVHLVSRRMPPRAVPLAGLDLRAAYHIEHHPRGSISTFVTY
jgi:hypothetical protein